MVGNHVEEREVRKRRRVQKEERKPGPKIPFERKKRERKGEASTDIVDKKEMKYKLGEVTKNKPRTAFDSSRKKEISGKRTNSGVWSATRRNLSKN